MGLLLFVTVLCAQVTVLREEGTYLELKVVSGDVSIETSRVGDEEYRSLYLEIGSVTGAPGAPALPSLTFSIAAETLDSVVVVPVNEEVFDKVYPKPVPVPVNAEGEKEELFDYTQGDVYQSGMKYPNYTWRGVGDMLYRGIPIKTVEVPLATWHPVTQQATLLQEAVVKVYFSQALLSSQVSAQDRALVSQGVVNTIPEGRNRAEGAGVSGEILILTTPEFEPALKGLTLWHKMKGYSVTVESQSSWSTTLVQSTVQTAYTGQNSPDYLLIVGDHEDIPGTPQVAEDSRAYVSDLPYMCHEGADRYPEMSGGRISVSSLQEAYTVVDKIIAYEQNPPTKASFYSTAMASAYFQDSDLDGEEDMGFVEHIEVVRDYLLDSVGLASSRAYYANSTVNPQSYETGLDPGGAIPTELTRSSGFEWNCNFDSISAQFNDGRFLVYHYDHGMSYGWVDPLFTATDVSTLTNGELLPVLLSIDCWVGKFDDDLSFAEALQRHATGGAVGVVASSVYTTTGSNDAFLFGLIDAIWPGLSLQSQWVNQQLQNHAPLYRMGDVVSQGLFRMSEQWNNESYYGENIDRHFRGYHWFGDPTTEIWTEEPTEITVDSLPVFAPQQQSYELTGLSCQSGLVTLVNLADSQVVGTATVVDGDALVSVTTPPSEGDSVIVTIREHNFRPLIDTIEVGVVMPVLGQQEFAPAKLVVLSMRHGQLRFNQPLPVASSLKLYDLQGRVVYEKELQAQTTRISIPGLSPQMLLLQLKTDAGETVSRRVRME